MRNCWIAQFIVPSTLLFGVVETPAFDLADALDTTNLTWTTSGSPLWFPETNITHDGIDAASSGGVSYPQSAILDTALTGPGTLTFWWRMTNSSFGSGTLAFSIGGTNQSSLFSSATWERKTFYLGSGIDTCRWACAPSSPPYSVTGWVDEVTYTPGPTPPLIVAKSANQNLPAGSDVTLAVTPGGTPPLNYQWLFNGTNIAGATRASLALTNVQAAHAGTYQVIITNNYGSTNASAVVTVNPSAPWFITQPSTREMVPGVTVTFPSAARGSEPLNYQWQFNNADLPGEQSSNLVLPSVQTNNAGLYRVVVTNAHDATNSSTANLIIVPMVIVGWGNNFFGQCDVPLGLTKVSAIGCGWDFSLAASKGAPVTDWGFSLSDFSPNLTNVIAVAGGQSHGIALGSDGIVNTVGGSPYPTPGLTNVVQVGAGVFFHDVVLQSDGRVIAWGGGTSTPQTNVPPNLTNAVAIAGGWRHDLALRNDGTVVAWGYDTYGETNVPTGLTQMVSVGAGWNHSLALRADGTVRAWGRYFEGQTNVPIGLSNVVAVSAGENDSLALKNDGTVVAWGGGFSGETNVPPWLTNVVAIASGQDDHLALLTDGSPYFTRQPYSQTVFSGSTVAFNPVVLGVQLSKFQWQFNGADIPGATNLSLAISNAPLTAGGLYRCLASNSLGVAISQSAQLTLLRSTPGFTAGPMGIQFTNGLLALRLSDCSGHGEVVIYATSDLLTWSPLLTNPPVVGSFTILDAFATYYTRRFYRAEEH